MNLIVYAEKGFYKSVGKTLVEKGFEILCEMKTLRMYIIKVDRRSDLPMIEGVKAVSIEEEVFTSSIDDVEVKNSKYKPDPLLRDKGDLSG